MKTRLGMDHVGLGTDGGGNIPSLIDGYRDVSNLVHLIAYARGWFFACGH